jgi:hypothetical protein
MFTKYASIQIWSSEKEICARNRIFNVVNIEVTSMHEISSFDKIFISLGVKQKFAFTLSNNFY